MVNFVHASFLLLLAVIDGSAVSATTAKRTVCLHIVLYISHSVVLILSYRIILCSFLIFTVYFLLHYHPRNQTGHGTTGDEAVRDAQIALPADHYSEVL